MDIPMKKFFYKISEKSTESKAVMSASNLTLDTKNDKLHIKIIVDNMNIERPTGEKIWISGTVYVFVTAP